MPTPTSEAGPPDAPPGGAYATEGARHGRSAQGDPALGPSSDPAGLSDLGGSSDRGGPPPSADPEPLRADGELRPLDPRVRILWRVSAGIRAVAWTGVVAGVEFFGWPQGHLGALLPGWVGPGIPTVAVAGLGLALLLVVPSLGYRRWRYALRTHDLWIRKGIVVHRVSVLPYRRLQFVDTRQGPLERWMGLMELVVHTAAPGTSGRIPGLAAAEAETLREVLSRFGPDGEDRG